MITPPWIFCLPLLYELNRKVAGVELIQYQLPLTLVNLGILVYLLLKHRQAPPLYYCLAAFQILEMAAPVILLEAGMTFKDALLYTFFINTAVFMQAVYGLFVVGRVEKAGKVRRIFCVLALLQSIIQPGIMWFFLVWYYR